MLTSDGPGGRVSDEDLYGSQNGAERERDPETESVVAIPPEYPGRVNRRHQEADYHVGRDDHASRLVHPGVRRHHRNGAPNASEGDRDTGPEVRPALQARPSVQIDAGEDRLEEDKDLLEAQQACAARSALPGSDRSGEGGPHRLHRAGMTSHQLDLRDRLV